MVAFQVFNILSKHHPALMHCISSTSIHCPCILGFCVLLQSSIDVLLSLSGPAEAIPSSRQIFWICSLGVVIWMKMAPKGSGIIRKCGLVVWSYWRKCVMVEVGLEVSYVLKPCPLPVTCKSRWRNLATSPTICLLTLYHVMLMN